MKYNEEKLTKEIEKKNEELSRIQGEQLQEHKQPDSLPTDINVSTCEYMHVYICMCVFVINIVYFSM